MKVESLLLGWRVLCNSYDMNNRKLIIVFEICNVFLEDPVIIIMIALSIEFLFITLFCLIATTYLQLT